MKATANNQPWRWVFLCVALFWGISLERTYAWLGLQSQRMDAWRDTGMHPLSFNFASDADYGPAGDTRHPVSAATQLIGARAIGASIAAQAQGLLLTPQPPASSFELRLNFAGARVLPADVDALKLRFSATGSPAMALAVHANAADAGWIADLPTLGSQNLASNERTLLVALNTLKFYREPARQQWLAWADLPAISHARLWVNMRSSGPLGDAAANRMGDTSLLLSSLSFQGLPKPTPRASGVLPEALLADHASAAFAGVGGTHTGYRGVWLSIELHAVITLGCVTAWLSALALALVGPPRQRGRVRGLLLGVSFLPPLLAQWGVTHAPSSAVKAPMVYGWAVALTLLAAYALFTVKSEFNFRLFAPIPRPANLGRNSAYWSCALPTLAIAAVLLLSFGLSDRAYVSASLLLKYALFATVQQLILQRVVLLNWRKTGVRRPVAVLLSACVFALCHTPNFMLMLLCFAGGLFWCGHYARHRRLFPIVISHAILGWLCANTLPAQLLRSANVGVPWFLS
jgi:hypothetical protein